LIRSVEQSGFLRAIRDSRQIEAGGKFIASARLHEREYLQLQKICLEIILKILKRRMTGRCGRTIGSNIDVPNLTYSQGSFTTWHSNTRPPWAASGSPPFHSEFPSPHQRRVTNKAEPRFHRKHDGVSWRRVWFGKAELNNVDYTQGQTAQ
jgi:hypothetical protein